MERIEQLKRFESYFFRLALHLESYGWNRDDIFKIINMTEQDKKYYSGEDL